MPKTTINPINSRLPVVEESGFASHIVASSELGGFLHREVLEQPRDGAGRYIMFRMGPGEILLIVLAVLIIFGPKRLPELGKGIGQFFKNFKKGIAGESSDNKDNKDNKDDKTS